MRFINNAIVPESTTEINLLEAFNSGIGPFTRELEKLTDQEYVTLLTLLDEYRAPYSVPSSQIVPRMAPFFLLTFEILL
jgi:hypothetical protein